MRPFSLGLELYEPYNLSTAVKYRQNSDEIDGLGDGAVTMDEESNIEGTGDGSPMTEA